ncbi:MAG: DNA repair protein RadC [Cellvibrionaceae bacterium]|nr:DNA repair protein RadC [Cellvibrionaceae bacterium]
MSITQWPRLERPREKLLARGPKALSDAELLAIFLRTGCRGQSAVDLARALLKQFKGLRPLLAADRKVFCRARGLGDAKFAQLQAVLEMTRRHLAEGLAVQAAMSDTAVVKHYLISQLRWQQREVFAVLFLDNQHHLIAYEELFQGTINSANVYPREIAKRALILNAAATILAHNHPSGVAEPSQADHWITREIQKALALLDINTLDHMIVGSNEVVSFAERGWMSTPP